MNAERKECEMPFAFCKEVVVVIVIVGVVIELRQNRNLFVFVLFHSTNRSIRTGKVGAIGKNTWGE